MMDYTFDEIEGFFRKAKKKRAMSKLWEYRKEIPDPFKPQFKVKILMCVPHPTLFQPFPCILVLIGNPKSKIFFRLTNLSDLADVFVLPTDEVEKARQSLCSAQEEAQKLLAIEKALSVGKELTKSLSSLSDKDFKEIEAFLKAQQPGQPS
jgi:hypothetical protein